ncbi:esterase [Pigmentiphaga sp. NML080357]|uniref:alpha/beta hydrolase n=1 Tax=Pigmentiphaga sp. NML080357 TaxID=2008675 RepID=UPI000B4120BD|nr:alpha/beta hydrolase [Pigmentiphaga sp. NML080357]OVZ55252.1 esterase [Pigmentiphaga sp. NML080357]
MTPRKPDLLFADLAERAVQYNARASVPDFDACVREYAELAEVARQRCAAVRDLYYGMGAAERLDIFLPTAARQPAPVFLFIHGGYWRSQTKEDAPIMAPAFNAAGVAVVPVEYTLLPEGTLAEAVREVRSAVAWIYHHADRYGLDRDRIYVGGSSAGGHLAGMLAATDWQDKYRVPGDVVKGVVALSGLFDVRPLCDINVNEWLRLYPDQAERLSPMFSLPRRGLPMIVSVGGLETDGFKNQTAAYEAACREAGLEVKRVEAAHCNHFNLLCELAKAESPLTRATLEMIGASR